MRQDDAVEILKRAQQMKAEGKYGDALQLRRELERLYDQSGSVAERSRNLNYITFLAVCVGDVNEAERAARKCLRLYRSLSTDQEKLATYLMMLSFVLAEKQQFEEAITYGEEAVLMFSQLHGASSSFVEARKLDLQHMRNKDIRCYIDR